MQLIIILMIGKKRARLVFFLRKMFGLCLSDCFQVSLETKLSKYITKKEFIVFILNIDIASSSLLFHLSRKSACLVQKLRFCGI